MEKEIGFPLFIRTKQAVTLTPAGAALYVDLKEISKSMNEALKNANSISKNTQYNLKLGIANHLNTPTTYSAIKNFQVNYPKSSVFVESVDFKTLRTNLVQGKYDFAISLKSFLSVEEIEMQPISRHKLFLACPKSHPVLEKKEISIADFKDEVFFILEAASNPRNVDLVFDICNKAGFTPKTEVCNSLGSYFIKLELGYGVAFFDTALRLPENFEQSFVYIYVNEEIAYSEVVAAWHKNNNNPAIQLFLNELSFISDS